MPLSPKISSADGHLWELERQVFQLRTLFEIAQALTACRDSESIFQQVLAILCGTYGVERAAGCVHDENENRWRCLALRGKEVPPIALTEYLKKPGIASLEALRSTIADFFVLTRPAAELAIVELRIKNRTAGLFFLGPKLSGESYQPKDLDMLTTAASFTANAIENIQLYEALQEAQKILRLENLSLREAVKNEYAAAAIIGASAGCRKCRPCCVILRAARPTC